MVNTLGQYSCPPQTSPIIIYQTLLKKSRSRISSYWWIVSIIHVYGLRTPTRRASPRSATATVSAGREEARSRRDGARREGIWASGRPDDVGPTRAARGVSDAARSRPSTVVTS